jgi:hypothetical protein
VRFAFLITLGAVTVAACGGGGGSDSLSVDEFRQRANAICERYDAKIAAIGSPSSPDEIPEFVDKGIPLIQQGLAELRALNPPEEFAEDYDRMLDLTAQAIPAARDLADAAAKQDAEAVQAALQAGETADEKSDQVATELGLDRCAAD